jgi:ABC-type branched-subunit amino acid transport system substrate-binding protein
MQGRPTTRRRAALVGGAALLALVAAACGSDNSSSGSAATTAAASATTASAAATTAAGAATTAGGTATTAAAAASGPATPVPIGLAFSNGASYGLLDQPSATGVKMAVKEINDAGGFDVGGKKYTFEIHEVDTTDTPAQATAAVQGLIDQYKPVAIFGPTVSPLAIATQVVANRDKTIEVSASTAWGAILGKPDTKFLIKTKAPEPTAARMQHSALLDAFPGMKTAVILATDEAAGHAAAGVWEKDQKELGLDVQTTYFPPDLTDASSLITKLRDNPPDLITVTGAAQPAMNAALDKLNESKIGKVLFSNCNYRAAHQFKATDLPFACISVPSDLPTTTNPQFTAFRDKLEAFTGKKADGLSFWALTQYPYVYALADAMKAAGSVTDTDAIVSHMRNYTSDDHAVAIKIDGNGESTTAMELTIVQNGATKVVTIEPPAS